MVATALGPDPDDGARATLMHEHIVTPSHGVQENWPHLWTAPRLLDHEDGCG